MEARYNTCRVATYGEALPPPYKYNEDDDLNEL